MKNWIFLAACLCSGTVGAQAVSYRDNDPFVFCRYGQKNLDRCWSPLSPAAGTILPSPWCKPQNPYGKTPTADDIASLAEWYSVCTGVGQGDWEGAGTGEQVPFDH